MSAQYLEQRARETPLLERIERMLAGLMREQDKSPCPFKEGQIHALEQIRAIVAALRQQPAQWQTQLADALDCFWNPAIEGSGDDRSNVIGGMVQGFAAVAYRLREHAATHQPAPVVDDADATEILALSLDEFGYHTEAKNVRAGEDLDEYRTEMWAIRAALARAQGVQS